MGEKEGYRMENGVLKNYRPFEKNDMENKYYRIFLKFYPNTQKVRLRESKRERGEKEGNDQQKFPEIQKDGLREIDKIWLLYNGVNNALTRPDRVTNKMSNARVILALLEL